MTKVCQCALLIDRNICDLVKSNLLSNVACQHVFQKIVSLFKTQKLPTCPENSFEEQIMNRKEPGDHTYIILAMK